MPRVHLRYGYVALLKARTRCMGTATRLHPLPESYHAETKLTLRYLGTCDLNAQFQRNVRDRNRYVRQNKNVRAVRNKDTRLPPPRWWTGLSHTTRRRMQLSPRTDNAQRQLRH